jgi:uncharacterized membrane protein
MKGYKQLLHVAICLLAACNNLAPSANTSTTAPDTTETDTINYALSEDSVKLQLANTTPPEGFYGVTLPCTNCKGIEHTILFNRDLSYRLEEKVLGSETAAKETTGSWKPVNGDIWLYKDSSVVARYTWKGDTLNYIDLKSSVRIPLRPLQSVLNVATWKDRREEGTDFFGVGNEPFWNIAIDEQKNIVFTLADWPKPVSFKSSRPVVSADSTVYQTRKDTMRLRVVIYNAFCSDGMSDNIYPNKIKVQYNKHVYEGCGMSYK